MKNKYRMICCLLLIIIITILIIYTFNENKKENEKILSVNLNTKDLINIILQEDSIKKHMDINSTQDITEVEMTNIYDIDLNLVEQYYGKVPTVSLSSDEIIIIKVKDVKDLTIIENKFKQRAKEVSDNFENYLETEHSNAKNPLILKKGKYIIFAINDNINEIKNIFENQF